MQRRAVALDWRIERHVAARAQDGGAMVSEQAVDQHRVAGAGAIRAQIDALADNADPRRGQEELVAGAFADDLGVAGDDRHARLARRRRHRSGDPAQEVDRHPFLDDRGAGEIERDCAPDREVVDRAADRELPDVAAGKDERIDDEGIGGEGKPVAAPREIGEIEPRLILERGEQGIVEGSHEHVVDQVLHRLAAAAMGKRHRWRMNLAEGSGADGRGDVHSAAS